MSADEHLSPSQFFHGTPADLKPGDLVEPNKFLPSHDPGTHSPPRPREHTYFSNSLDYVSEHYGPNVYEVEPLGKASLDPEYRNSGPEYGKRRMMHSKDPLRVVRRVRRNWGEPDD